MTTYIERARAAFLASSAHIVGWDPEADPVLTDLYTLLVLTRGTGCSCEDVHDAWSLATQRTRPEHRSLVPFVALSPEVQGYDVEFRDAVRHAAATLIGVGA